MYIIVVAVIVIIALNFYIWTTSTFWGMQPVFHIYDIHHWVYPVGVIRNDIGGRNKYVDDISVKTINVRECPDNVFNDVSEFITNHFLGPDDFKYSPSPTTLKKTLDGSDRSYITIYRDNIGICSVITATSYNIYIDNKCSNTHYVDHLCVRNDMRKKSVAPKTISTMIYNVSKNVTSNTFLFKREGDLTGIVPLNVFNMSSYLVKDIQHMDVTNDDKVNIKRVSVDDIPTLIHFMNDTAMSVMDVVVIPSSEKLLHLIESNIFMIYEITDNDNNILGLYVFKQTSVTEANRETIECIMAFNHNMNPNDFTRTFIKILVGIAVEFDVFYVTINELCNGPDICNNLSVYIHDSCIAAYFMYNYATYTKPARKCIILC